ncbi:MAG: transcriptional regulator [Ilumatobacteraceae bacterium]|nr:transcriptional regulator [Ilumatobacteraceae bacterium]
MTNDAQRRDDHTTSTAAAFVEIVAALVDDFDVIDVLTGLATRSIELLNASAAGILLADPAGNLIVTAASTDQIGLLELFQIQNEQGPCLDCFTTGAQVMHPSLDRGSPWPEFARESVAAGFPSVYAVPLRLKNTVIGCLNLFMTEAVVLSRGDIALAQALADVATIAIIQDQATRDAAIRESSLQNALTSRVVIEQAKGMIAERLNVDMDTAFGRLRAYARHTNQRLSDVAMSVANGTTTIAAINTAARPPAPPRR